MITGFLLVFLMAATISGILMRFFSSVLLMTSLYPVYWSWSTLMSLLFRTAICQSSIQATSPTVILWSPFPHSLIQAARNAIAW